MLFFPFIRFQSKQFVVASDRFAYPTETVITLSAVDLSASKSLLLQPSTCQTFKNKHYPNISLSLICKEMFLNLYGISNSWFQRLVDHYQNHGISLQTHGNSKRLPHNTLPQAIAEDVKNFLSNYAQENALLLPGRIPGFKDEYIQLLSSSDTKMHVWNSFKRACEESNKQVVSYPKFTLLWKQFHPNVIVAKPMTALCFTCQQNTSEKSDCVQAQQEHLNSVQIERELYRKVCEETKCIFEAVEDQLDLDERHEACSLTTTMHYSFDFAQQVHFPSNPMRPDPIYCGVN